MGAGSGSEGATGRALAGRPWTRDDIPALWAAFAATGFPCALRAIRELERDAEAEETEVPDRAVA